MAMENKPLENEIRLYLALVDQIQKYSSVFWQFPTALIAANYFAFDKFLTNHFLLLALAIIDAVIIFAFQKMVKRQSEIIKTTKLVEVELRKTFAVYIPTFKQSIISAPKLTVYTLWFFDLCLLLYSVIGIMVKYLCS